MTRFGGFFDTVLDRFVDLATVAALGIYSLQTLPLIHNRLIPTSSASAGVVLVSYVSIAVRGRIDLQRLRGSFHKQRETLRSSR